MATASIKNGKKETQGSSAGEDLQAVVGDGPQKSWQRVNCT